MAQDEGGSGPLADPYLQRALDAIESIVGGLGPEAWDQAPPGKWSPAQILEHLGKAFAGTAYILDKGVADGAPKGRPPSWRQRLFAALVVDVGYFPTGVPAPEITRPQGLRGPEALAFARDTLRDLDAAAVRCEARFGRRALVANHPILGGFTVGRWRRFHWRHTVHHMRQIAHRRA